MQERAARLRQGGIPSSQLPQAPRDAAMDMPPDVPVPSQLLGLLPPPPVGGWPDGFLLDKAAQALQGQLVGTASLYMYICLYRRCIYMSVYTKVGTASLYM